MGKKKPESKALVKTQPKLEEPVEVVAFIPRDEFPERLTIRLKGDQTVSYTRAQMEAYYEQAYIISQKRGEASCWQWMEELKIDYCATVWIMDIMESRGVVPILEYKDGVPTVRGPRRFKGKRVTAGSK
jgi:hypothetical protein